MNYKKSINNVSFKRWKKVSCIITNVETCNRHQTDIQICFLVEPYVKIHEIRELVFEIRFFATTGCAYSIYVFW